MLDEEDKVIPFLLSSDLSTNITLAQPTINPYMNEKGNGVTYIDQLIINTLSNDGIPLASLAFDIKIIIIAILTVSLLSGSFFKCIM